MKDFIIYTTQGTTFGPNTNVDIENCQVLGIIQSTSVTEAIDELFKNNEWIHRAGFSKDYVMVKQLFSSSNREDVSEVIDYLWKDGQHHFQEDNYPKNHIVRVIKRLKKLL